ncbi:hypothetical protein pEaSNUABM11_00169 [Erwinia phage pEa_SNUABM_11]|nr:hypothetical protein pEaSNUABM11_00169 [Erwinia phage pEa_SNUABM_11]
MSFYSKAALQLIYDQVNRDNPGLPVPLSASNAALSKTPVAVNTTTYGRNTRVEFTAFPGSGLQGSITLYYDRVSLSKLYSLIPTVYLSATVTTQQAALTALNDALGLSLTADDLSTPTAAIAAPSTGLQAATFVIKTTSPAYLDQIVFNYQIKSSGFYPSSGPGPKNLLVGDKLMGYFGTVDTTDLFSHQEFLTAALLKGTTATRYTGTEGWHKFYYNSAILYSPITPVASNISWASIYNEGLVFGTDDTGKYPVTATPVNQLRILGRDSAMEGKFYYKVRLPSCGADPFTQATSLGSGDYAGSEAQMISFLNSGKWGKLTGAWWTNWCIYKNSVSNNPTTQNKLGTPNMASWANNAKTAADAGYYWWPILELVDTSSTVLGLESVFGQMDRTITPVVYNVEQQLQVSVLQLGQPKTLDFQPIPYSTEQSLYVKPLVPGQPKTIDFRPIPFKVEIYTPSKVDLSNTNGDLDDF